MKTKYPATVMVLSVVSNKGDIMTIHSFKQGIRVNADAYLDVLQNVVVQWMKKVENGRHFTFQQNGAPAHNAKKFKISSVRMFLNSGQRRYGHLALQIQIHWTITYGAFAKGELTINLILILRLLSYDWKNYDILE